MAHLLRQSFPQHWLRIHSLPDMKRYPEDDAERQVVLQRQTQFGTALLGEEAACLVVQSLYAGSPRSPELLPALDWRPIHQVVGEDEDDSWDSWIAHTVWEPTALAPLLLAIAEDRYEYVAFLSEVTDCIYVPYDGGADGFSFDAALLQRLSQEFVAWRSPLPSGL